MNRMILPVVIGALAVAGCQKKAETPAAEKPTADTPATTVVRPLSPPVESAATAENSVAYTCDKDVPITAIYGKNAEGKSDAVLVVKGQSFNLDQVISASGARYASRDGLEAGKGIVWWTKGGEATLYETPAATFDDMDTAKQLRSCKSK